MKNKILKIAFLFVLIFLGILTNRVNATYKSNDPVVTSGETITITVKSTESLENYDISLKSYTGLTYVSCSAENAAVNSSSGKISFATLGTGATTLGTFTFKAPEVTEIKKFSVVFNINDGETTNTSTVTVNPVKTETNTNTNTSTSTNNNSNTNTGTTTKTETKEEKVKKGTINTFKINGITVKESLKVTNQDSVSIKVNTSTKEGATVYNSATKKSYKLKSGTATNIQIVEGTNTLTITLDTGHKETRKIYSQKEEVVEPNVIEEKKEEVKVLLKSLGIKASISEEENVDISLTPEFSSEVYEYNVLLDESLADVTKLNIDAVPTSDEFKVEIFGNEDLKVGHNTITITVKSKDEKNTATYKILAAKLAKIVPVVAEPVVEVQQEVVKPLWNRNQQILISVFTSIIAIMGIIYAIIEYRYKKAPEEGIPNSGSTLEEDLNKDIQIDEIGDIPFAKIGYEKEDTDKIDVLKDEEYENQNEESIEQKNNEREENKKTSKRRGKHF